MAIKAAKKPAAVKKSKAAAKALLDAANPAWSAGMGALAKAQQEGAKVFESLRRQQQQIQQKTRAAAADTAARAREMQQLAGGTLDKLEQVFEERVARSLSRLGIHTQHDLQQLAGRVDELSDAVNKLLHAQGKAPVAAKGGAKRAAKRVAKAPVRKTAKAATKRPRKTAA